MKRVIVILLFLPVFAKSHPGIGIVKDSKGNIYYTDLQQVWKITNGMKAVAVPNVHTHKLWVDSLDNLFGENEIYHSASNKYYHYLWVCTPSGKIDTVIGVKEAYLKEDFSLARDRYGNEYYTKAFLTQPDTNHIYKRTPSGSETIFATGEFNRSVKWLHPQHDGSVLFERRNAVYRVDSFGNITLIKEAVANSKPSFAFSENNITLWGVWQDDERNVYAAAFSDQAVKKIDANGYVSVVHRSKGNWAPLLGIFDQQNQHWILEASDKNEIRVVPAGAQADRSIPSNQHWSLYIIIGAAIVFVPLLYRRLRKRQ